MSHVVLLGDSIFDNAAYVGGGPDVVRQMRTMLPSGWTATLLAVDGATIADVPSQLRRLPSDATHLVLSAGGNDVLAHTDLPRLRSPCFSDAILRLAAEHAVPAIELRLFCTEPRDYANPIEPSVAGGAKIARAILGAVT